MLTEADYRKAIGANPAAVFSLSAKSGRAAFLRKCRETTTLSEFAALCLRYSRPTLSEKGKKTAGRLIRQLGKIIPKK